MPVVIAMTSDHSPASQKKRYVGIVYCAISLGGMLCAAIMATGWLGADWRPIYYVGGVLPIAVALAMFVYLPASRPKSALATDGRASKATGPTSSAQQAADHADAVAGDLPHPRRDVSVRAVDADAVAAARVLADRGADHPDHVQPGIDRRRGHRRLPARPAHGL